MNSNLQTPIRSTSGEVQLSSPFRTPVRKQPASQVQSPHTPYTGQTPLGKWTNPEAQRVLDDRAIHPSTGQSTMRLRWNVASLLVLAWCTQTGVYRQIKSFGQSAGVPMEVWSWVEWMGVFVLAYNIGEAMWVLLQPQRQYADAAMTASQRLRMGLDSSCSSKTPVSAPKMTPSRATPTQQRTPGSAVTDLESRRRTPVRGTAGVLRSPSARGDGQELTLTQVLKKVPGASMVTDLSTPTRASDHLDSPFHLPTPRLPMGQRGLSDVAATPLQQHLHGQPIGLYHTATPVGRSGGGEGTKGTARDGASSVEYLEPDEVLERYMVERELPGWVENMHVWFVRHLLRPLDKQIKELDALFEQHGLGHLSCRRAVLDPKSLDQSRSQQPQPSLFGSQLRTGFGGLGNSMTGTNVLSHAPGSQTVPQTLEELTQRYGDLPQTKERMALEKYLLVPTTIADRSYVVDRVATLAQSGALPAYVFDAGGSSWNASKHPTDAQLLFHLFCTFMDQSMPPVQNTRRPFTDRFVLQAENRPNSNLPVQIIQVSRKKPHFCLVVKGAFYDVAAGHNNLFATLVLFVLEVQRECAGYLGLTNLGGKQVDLLNVIS
ncbi:hypothetical protein LPJ78_003166 [Coemansia sp. RSA 989]|nr:cytochrome B561, N terminal-domain-containing protein [Coemansia mojavensis]KAJ1742011.1 hypothetical protein LPJ68_002308 [Coemansia sp. RSA 1086]KAJ1864740.1 hypothetical protein LPJ78_003166 [Coemansia sp. RSA 989]KAJ1872276.1 hypothetical protein LPJ55_003226 [Coemansia sp. RSA 990]